MSAPFAFSIALFLQNNFWIGFCSVLLNNDHAQPFSSNFTCNREFSFSSCKINRSGNHGKMCKKYSNKNLRYSVVLLTNSAKLMEISCRKIEIRYSDGKKGLLACASNLTRIKRFACSTEKHAPAT